MNYSRDELLKDLREGVVETTVVNPTTRQKVVTRCTLLPRLLPKCHNSQADLDFHAKYPDLIACINVMSSGYYCFSIKELEAMQELDQFNY